MLVGRVLAGGLLLVLGRKLFWLYVAVLGFAAGLTVASNLFHIQQEGLALLIGLACGLIGALLAYFFQHIAIGLAGFLAGAYITSSLMNFLGLHPGLLGWLLFVVGGVIGAILMSVLFEWALIFLTSAVGTLLILEAFQVSGWIGWLAGIVLFVIGLVIQTSVERSERRSTAQQ